MTLPSNTYTNRSALCRCGWEASPGAKSTFLTIPSLSGTSGRSLVIRRVTFPTGNASTLPNASTLLNASNRDNTGLFIFYSFQQGLPLGFVLFDLNEPVEVFSAFTAWRSGNEKLGLEEDYTLLRSQTKSTPAGWLSLARSTLRTLPPGV